jgi:hypothetical protein
MRRSSLVVVAVLFAGCGAGATGPTHHAPAAPHCPARMGAALGGGARVRVVSHEPALITCAYGTPAATVRVTFDDGPQAWFRWMRAQVERTQTSVEWSDTPGDRPRDVHGVGAGAFWVTAPRQLVASDGRRLLTIKVLRPRDPARARRLAERIAPAGLGPARVPVATGP